ncbi:helix-turn-helix domain-containing protein [Gulosibacter sp. 10]|uniref:helix-turn-helix domain-containing protein n=1 Tax=Gulosibacter sp. 10 TaxID=1255570 RepID=UPI00097F1732|nr:helix-turn-helix domain-containing protein [Gulosibacter sp. 10]SJM57455.1 Transcriptional regulator, AraC family [Gulosibacter sp. 10]
MTVMTAENVAQWQALSSRIYVPLYCSEIAEDFEARVDLRIPSPFLSLTRIDTGSVHVQRSTTMAAGEDEEFVLFAIQDASSGSVSQYGRDAMLRPGDAVLYETRGAYEIDHRQPGQRELIAKIRRSAIHLPSETISANCGRLIAAGEPRLRVVSAYMEALFADTEELSLTARFEMAAVAVDLLETLLRPDGERAVPEGREQLLEQLKMFVIDSLGSPRLTVESLAAHHHLSVRTVYQLFEATGEPPGVFIRRARLRRAASLLGDASGGRRTVASIAAECGFPDPSTFTRAFRREYGVAPTAWMSEQASTG